MKITELQKELNKTLKTYQNIYKSNLKLAEEQMDSLDREEKKEIGSLLGEIKLATKELDSDKLRDLLKRVNLKRK